MNKSSILILTGICVFFTIAIFAYQQQNAPLQLANQAIASIDLKNFKARAVLQKKKSFEQRLTKADALFDSKPLEAAGIYQDLLKSDPGRLDLRMRLGMLHLKNRQHEAAREHLHIIYEYKSASLQPDAAWFLALLAIAEQNESYAKKLLAESLEAGSQYQQEAEKLHQLLK